MPASSEVVKHNYRSAHLPDDVDAFKFSKFSHLYFQVGHIFACHQSCETRASTLMQILFSFDQDMRVEKTLI